MQSPTEIPTEVLLLKAQVYDLLITAQKKQQEIANIQREIDKKNEEISKLCSGQ